LGWGSILLSIAPPQNRAKSSTFHGLMEITAVTAIPVS
jgi:hypothetical protein